MRSREFVGPAARGVLVAAALECAVGEPPVAVHPVVGVGRYLNRAASWMPSGPASVAVPAGGVAWGVGAAGAVGAGLLVDRSARHLSAVPHALAIGLALWPLLSARMLLREVAAVEEALSSSVEDGRRRLSRIVSRDTSALEEPEVRAAALESLSENMSDSVVAPLFWFLVAGLPGAAGYRFVNTADAMWGYRSPRWEYAGKVAARADDLLNLVPARITGALYLLGGPSSLWRRLPRNAAETYSPNAGWPMSALALRLDIRLGKEGSYLLNAEGSAPARADTVAALRLSRRVVIVVWGATAVVVEVAARLRARRL